MALDHVHQRPGRVVVAGAVLQGELLVEHDVDVIDVIAVPQGFEQVVRESHAEQIEHRRASQEVVDPVDLSLGHQFGQQLVEAGGTLLVGPERLLEDQGGVPSAATPP